MTTDIETRKRTFTDLLNSNQHEEEISQKIRQAIDDGSYRVIVDINKIRASNPGTATELINEPRETLFALQESLSDVAKSVDSRFEKLLNRKPLQVGIEGSVGAHSVSPRGLSSRLLNKLVEVEGIVVKCSSVRPKLMKSTQYCPTTGLRTEREFRDATSLSIGIQYRDGQVYMPTNATLPTVDDSGNPLEIEHGFCVYKDYQTLVLQEMPEKSRVGQLPRSVDVIMEHDLVDRCKPGDRVICNGVYRSLPSQMGGQTNGVFKTVLICNNIAVIGKEVGAVKLTFNDTKNIRELAKENDVLRIMAHSLCPSIFGHEFVKKAIILQLVGGLERNLENGTHLRGDINIMMVGDPSTAKSQLLRAVMDIAPLAISTTGRGSSGVGLTAAVTIDHETGEKRLEAGAMVLADRGVVCIDEFDKMSENDRVAIHEVMEQQTVTIAKAGIHAALNARCSVIAAANPIYGQYDKSRRPQENIGLPDSLLSRFDLLFIVLDQLDPALDRRLSEHVIRSHQYRRPGTVMEPEPLNQQSTLNLDDSNDNNTPVDTPVWLRSGNSYTDVSARRGSNDVLTKDFLRKYIHFAKRIQPVLSEEAIDRISSAYATMRAQQSRKNLPITARTLETVIRLSTAAAKIRLSQSVEVEDVETAIELLNFVLFHEIGSQESKAQHVDSVNSSSTANAEDDATSTEGEEIELDESNMGTESTVDQSLLQAAVKVIATQRQIDTISIAEFAVLLKENSSARFDHSELTSVLQNLEQSNHIMLDDQQIIIV